MSILEVKNIQKNFGSTEVLKNISFSMEEGTALSIIGSSGSGKTTLLRCLNCLETPETLFDAGRHEKASDEEIRKKRLHFGMVFQSFNLFPQYTALENVMLAPKLLLEDKGKDKEQEEKKIREHAMQLLDQMGLSNRMDNYPH